MGLPGHRAPINAPYATFFHASARFQSRIHGMVRNNMTLDCCSNYCHINQMPVFDSETFNPDISVGYLTKRIHQMSVSGLDRAFAGEDVTYLQWTALVSIHYGRGATCKALAHEIAHDRGATTRLLDTLEKRHLVVRQRDPDDRRIVNLALTGEGEAIARRCLMRVVDLWNGWLADWEPNDVVQLIGYLQRLRTTLELATTGDEPCA